MDPRRFNTFIDILAKQTRRDQKSGESIVEYKPLHRKQPALKADVAGGENRRGDSIEATTETTFVIRYIRDLGSEIRVQDRNTGLTYDVDRALDRKGDARFLELQCARSGDDGQA